MVCEREETAADRFYDLTKMSEWIKELGVGWKNYNRTFIYLKNREKKTNFMVITS